MAELIQPVLDTLKTLLEAMDASTLGELEPFKEVRSAGTKFNFPFASIEPGRTTFNPEADQAVDQVHQILIRIGVQGTEPEAIKTRCVAYAKAVWQAITNWPAKDWPAGTLFVMPLGIDYSVTYGEGPRLARFVDLEVGIRVQELP